MATLTEESEDVSPQEQKLYYHKDPSKDKCTMPCEMTAKLMRDEKHSLCSWCLHVFNKLHRFCMYFCFVSPLILPFLFTKQLLANLQHTMVSYTRNTRKLIRDLIEEQQKALEFLSSQVKKCSKSYSFTSAF